MPEVREGGVWEERERGGRKGKSGGAEELERSAWDNFHEEFKEEADEDEVHEEEEEEVEKENESRNQQRVEENNVAVEIRHNDETITDDAATTSSYHASGTKPAVKDSKTKPNHHKNHKAHPKRKSKSRSKPKSKSNKAESKQIVIEGPRNVKPKSKSSKASSKNIVIEGPRNVLLHEAVRKLLKFDFSPSEPKGRHKKLIPDPRVPPPMPRYVLDLYEKYQSGEMRHGPSLGNTVRSIPAEIGE